MPDTSSWQLRDGEQIIACNKSLLGQKHFLIGITRVRHEALILRDTLDYVGKHVDAIVAYDDASTDRTLEISWRTPKSRSDCDKSVMGSGHRGTPDCRGSTSRTFAADGARTVAVRLDILLRCG